MQNQPSIAAPVRGCRRIALSAYDSSDAARAASVPGTETHPFLIRDRWYNLPPALWDNLNSRSGEPVAVCLYGIPNQVWHAWKFSEKARRALIIRADANGFLGTHATAITAPIDSLYRVEYSDETEQTA